MQNNLPQDLQKIEKELKSCKRQLKKAQEYNERLRASVGYEELKGWKPQNRIGQQYGWIFAWLYPLSTFLNESLNEPISPETRNKIIDIVTAIFAQMAIEGKYGVKLPHDPRPTDMEQYVKKQKSIFKKSYVPCEICGESRITHECHIIPRSEGGPLHIDNFVMLCPLHHHLFDHSRLTEQEWKTLESTLDNKMNAAKEYAIKIRLPIIQEFWLSNLG